MNKEPSQVKKSKDEILMQVCNITDKEEWSYVEHITPIQALKAMEEYRSQSELPSDDRMIVEILNKIVKHSKQCRPTESGHGIVVALANECLTLLSGRSPNLLLASHVARIKELEEALVISEEIVSELNRGYNRFM